MRNVIQTLKQGSQVQTNSNKSVARPYFEAMENRQNTEKFSSGVNKAYWAWYYSDCQGEIICDTMWNKEVHDFVSTMREAGVKSFIYIDKSTALMGNLHAFVKEGCEISNLVVIEEGEGMFYRKIEGIRIRINR